jgi:hypothetical protein
MRFTPLGFTGIDQTSIDSRGGSGPEIVNERRSWTTMQVQVVHLSYSVVMIRALSVFVL